MADITRADSGEYSTTCWDMFKSMWEANLLDKKFDEKCTRMCFQFCYLFPKDYEFCMDEIIQLWIAEGFIPLENETHQKLETTAAVLFETFRRMTVFQYVNGGPRYKLNESVVYFFSHRHEDEYCRVGDENSYISEKTLHSSCRDSIDPLTLNDLYQATNLCTLMILHEDGSHFDKVPQDLFLKLRLLRVLDFSHTSIMELPSSVRNLKALRYLNLSGTPITTLPKSLCSLHELQTLKLKDCFKLVDLPKGMRKLANLRHLDVDVARLLVSMPPGLGDLTELQTLPAFVVGKENGCHLTELEHMVNLHGDFHILRLENVSCSEEAKKAGLGRKYYLDKLELQWTELQDGFEILQSLQPHRKLKELQIVGYGDAKFPSWIGDPNFSKLVSITLHDCRKCGLLSPLGKLPFLKSISISQMHEVKIIDHRFCGRDLDLESMEYLRKLDLGTPYEDLSADDAFKAFPKLESLTLNGLPKLEKWTGMVEGDFPHLQKLNIFGCSELVALPQLSLLNSLQTLEVRLCPLLESYPKDGLPNSLHYLVIIDCPLLKEWCLKEEGHQCGKVELIRHIWIDYQHFLGVRSLGFLEKEEREKRKTQLSEIPSTQPSYVGIESAQSSYDIRDLSAHGRSSQHGQALKLAPTPSSKRSLKVEYEAALKLQKVYKSFRTRRKLADFAVLVEQQWSKLLDFAELKRSSLSFFDIENTETSVSRWSRARTRVSRVGIGLSKDEKAQKLALQHWLEAIDPRHRYGHNLQYYYATWLRSESQQPFFYWLDIGDGKEVNLVDECPRSRLNEQCIKYLDPIERKAYEVTVEDGKFYKQGGELLDTSNGAMDAKWMFVLSTSKTLYVGRKRKGIFQHSSFLAGGATSAAGKLVVENGVLKAVWPHSGHYRPTEQNFQEFITFLKEHNVDLTDVKISPSTEDQERSSKNAGETVLEAEDISARIKTKQARAKSKAFFRRHSKLKLANLEVPKMPKAEIKLANIDTPEGSVNDAKKGYKLTSQESQLAEGYETDSVDGEEDKDYMVSKRKLFGGEREDKGYISLQELIPRRFISEKGMVSYQLGKQLSRNWATGAGPRIGCVRDKPSNFQLRLLNQVSL